MRPIMDTHPDAARALLGRLGVATEMSLEETAEYIGRSWA